MPNSEAKETLLNEETTKQHYLLGILYPQLPPIVFGHVSKKKVIDYRVLHNK